MPNILTIFRNLAKNRQMFLKNPGTYWNVKNQIFGITILHQIVINP